MSQEVGGREGSVAVASVPDPVHVDHAQAVDRANRRIHPVDHIGNIVVIIVLADYRDIRIYERISLSEPYLGPAQPGQARVRILVAPADGGVGEGILAAVFPRIRPEDGGDARSFHIVHRQRHAALDLEAVAAGELEIDAPRRGELGERIGVPGQILHLAAPGPEEAVREIVGGLAAHDHAPEIRVEGNQRLVEAVARAFEDTRGGAILQGQPVDEGLGTEVLLQPATSQVGAFAVGGHPRMVEPVGGARSEQVTGEPDHIRGVVEGHHDVALGTAVQRVVGQRLVAVLAHRGEGVAAVERIRHLADGVVAGGHLLLVAVSEGGAQQHDAVGSESIRVARFARGGAMQVRDAATVGAPLPGARTVSGAAAPAFPQLALLEGSQHIAALHVQHVGDAREPGVAGDEGEGPLHAGGDQMTSIRAQRDRFIHPGIPDGPGRLPRSQLHDLAAGVVLEQIRVVLVLEQEGHGARWSGRRARVANVGP